MTNHPFFEEDLSVVYCADKGDFEIVYSDKDKFNEVMEIPNICEDDFLKYISKSSKLDKVLPDYIDFFSLSFVLN